MFNFLIKEAKYVEGFKIWLAFADGKNGEIDLSDKLKSKSGIFEPLKNVDYFKNFKIRGQTIAWENGADIAPESLYELMEQQKSVKKIEMIVRKARAEDVDLMVELSHQKRISYEKAQPQFWKMAKNSDEMQKNWFLDEIQKQDVIALICINSQKNSSKTPKTNYQTNFLGFLIGKIIEPPAVYSAGLTLMIDDFCVSYEIFGQDSWVKIGQKLLDLAINKAKKMGVKQILVVCGNHDLAKQKFLEKNALTTTSNWLAKGI